MAKRTRRVFTPEYKAEAVRLSQTGNGNIAATARDLGIDVTTLRDWLRRAMTEEPESSLLSLSEKQELLQLRRDVTVLRMEREILKNRPRGSAHLWKEKLLRCYSERRPGRSGRLLFGDDSDPVKKHCPGTVADLAVVTPSGDPV